MVTHLEAPYAMCGIVMSFLTVYYMLWWVTSLEDPLNSCHDAACGFRAVREQALQCLSPIRHALRMSEYVHLAVYYVSMQLGGL